MPIGRSGRRRGLSLRILMLVRELATGTQTYTESITRELAKGGAEVLTVYTGDQPQRLHEGAVKLDGAVPRQLDAKFMTQLFRFLPVLLSMKGCVARFRPNVIYAQGLDENGFIAALASLVYRRPAITFVHDRTMDELLLKNPRFPSLLYGLSLFRQKIAARRLSAVLVGSEFMRSYISRVFGVPAVITKLGTRQELQGLKASPPDVSFRMIFVGNLTRKKRPDTLVRIVDSLRDLNLKLVFVGDGPEKERLSELCDRLQVTDRVEFRGRLSTVDLVRELLQSHVCVVPSLWEGFGLIAVEAMSHGVPVIASNSGGLREVVEDGKTGFLVPVDADHAWAQCVRRLYHDRILLRNLADNAYEAAKKYDWKYTVEKTLAVIRELTVERNGHADRDDMTIMDRA